MARIRSIHPDLHRDKTLATVSASAERTFVRLWCHLDDDGRGEDDPDLLKADLYPRHREMDADAIDADLRELEAAGLIIRYAVDGEPLLTCKPETWAKYQRPQKKQESKLPGPDQADPDPDPADTSTQPLHDQSDTATGGISPVGEGRGEGVGVGESHAGTADAATGDSLKLIHPEPEDDGFEDFWDEYPRHHKSQLKGGGGDKQKTHKQWKRLSKAQRAEVMEALKGYQRVCQEQYPKHAERFLTAEAWKTYLDVPEDATQQDVAALLGDRGFA